MASFIISPSGTITIYVNGRSTAINKEHQNYRQIIECLNDEDDIRLIDLLNVEVAVDQYSNGEMKIRNGKIYWNDHVVENALTDRILEFMKEELPYKPLIEFFRNLMQNPSARALSALYVFLEHKGLPITPDGHFIAYKTVRPDWTDWFSGTVDNSVGATPYMDRNFVDDSKELECSFGYHCGTMQYVRGYHSIDSSHYVRVKVNPRDVVSIPEDGRAQKLRACTYLVLEECNDEQINEPLFGHIADDEPEYDNDDSWVEDEEDDESSWVEDSSEDEEDEEWDDGEEDLEKLDAALDETENSAVIGLRMDSDFLVGEAEVLKAISKQAKERLSVEELKNILRAKLEAKKNCTK